jgi:hypothetical protein
MKLAPLPGNTAEDSFACGCHARVIFTDDQLNTFQSAIDQSFQRRTPMCFCLTANTFFQCDGIETAFMCLWNLKGDFANSGLDYFRLITVGMPLSGLIALVWPGSQIVLLLNLHGFIHHYSDQLE